MDTGLIIRRTITNNATAYSVIWICISKAMYKMLKRKRADKMLAKSWNLSTEVARRAAVTRPDKTQAMDP